MKQANERDMEEIRKEIEQSKKVVCFVLAVLIVGVLVLMNC